MITKARPTWQEWAMSLAQAAATRGDCSRRQVGAVLVRPDRSIAGAAYNGTYPGGPSCLKGECPRGKHYPVVFSSMEGEVCADKTCPGHYDIRECTGAQPGSSYDTGPGACNSFHAELNLVAMTQEGIAGYDVYVTHEPCLGCQKVLKAARVRRVYFNHKGMIVCMPMTREG